MKVRKNTKPGALAPNHKETQVTRAAGLRMKTRLKAGAMNHNETSVRG
jgi:hypothetical protein